MNQLALPHKHEATEASPLANTKGEQLTNRQLRALAITTALEQLAPENFSSRINPVILYSIHDPIFNFQCEDKVMVGEGKVRVNVADILNQCDQCSRHGSAIGQKALRLLLTASFYYEQSIKPNEFNYKLSRFLYELEVAENRLGWDKRELNVIAVLRDSFQKFVTKNEMFVFPVSETDQKILDFGSLSFTRDVGSRKPR